jgi:septum formation protein
VNPPLILASSSPRRRDLLASFGLEFTIIKPDIDEGQHPGEAPLDYVRRLSREKAAAVARPLRSPAAVLAADTVVILAADTLGVDQSGEILGKPVDADDARRMLQRLRRRVHQVYTAMTIYQSVGDGTPVQFTSLTRTDVFMREYSDAEIEAYIATGDPFDKAGSYAIQHEGFHPVDRIDGCYTNVVGLPVCEVRQMLATVGWPGMMPTACDCGRLWRQ